MLQKRIIKDALARYGMLFLAFSVSALIFVIAFSLFLKSGPILKSGSLFHLLFSVVWKPSEGHFGLAPFILGTIWVTAVAMILAIPPALLTAIYLAEYSHSRVRDAAKPILDLLAGISPVIYGAFGVLTIVPFVKNSAMPFAKNFFGFLPIMQTDNFSGFGIFSAGIVLALMIFPTITSVAEEVIHSISHEAREASLALGTTKWETIKHVVLRKSGPGIVAAIILGLSRAFGETIAVLMVVGNVVKVPKSFFDAAYTLPALIANNYGEMLSIPLYDSALLFAALILLGVAVFFNVFAWYFLLRIERAYV